MHRMFRVGLVLGLSLGFSAGARAQLTEDDIAALRARGEQEGWTFTVDMNPACVYPLSQLCGVKEPARWRDGAVFDDLEPSRSLPTAYDWRNVGGQNYCTPIRNQGGCGSCWAFGVTAALESNILIKDGVSTDLSEQWLVSCCRYPGELYGCDGGWPGYAVVYYQCDGPRSDSWGGRGAVPESAFPYVTWDAPCTSGPYSHPYCLNSWAFIGDQWGVPTVAQLKQAIYDHGPICVCVYVNAAFQAYSGGIFNACEDVAINHAVVLVGWNDAEGGYWILRNSWGPWGESNSGYMRIAYNCSRVGYHGLYVSYNSPELTVTPANGLSSTGFQGGPFSPSSKAYMLTNTGGRTLNWTAAKTQAWVMLSSTGGTLAAGGTASVMVSINSNANSLNPGTYNDAVTFTNTTNGQGNTTRSVSLTVNAPAGALSVTPADGLSSSGDQGGPFSPSSKGYTLTNTGGQSINWTAAKTQAWVTLSSTGGTLTAGRTATVTVSVNSNANALSTGSYNDTVTFTNTTNGMGNTTRPVALTVQAPETFIVETATMGPTNQITGPIVAADQYLGTAFTITTPATITRVGGHFGSVQAPPYDRIFFAIVPLGADGFPQPPTPEGGPPPLSNAILAGTIEIPIGSNEILADVSGALIPGNYALVFGAGGSFGSSPSYSAWAPYGGQQLIGSPRLFHWTGGNPGWFDFSAPVRFLLEGSLSQSPPEMTVTPGDSLSSSGYRGGPFSPSSAVYTLTNTGGQPMNWTAAKTQAWVTLSTTGGTLTPGGTTTVTVSINSNANGLTPGTYNDTVTFTNTTNAQGNTTRAVTLLVRPRGLKQATPVPWPGP